MMSVWTGTLSFGLVNIPVRMYPATQPKDVRFHLVDPESGRRVRFKRVVDVDEESEPTEPRQSGSASETVEQPSSPEARPAHREVEVAFDDLVRGYEVDKGQFVTLRPDEIERARPSRSRSIDIEHFVELESIDPVYFEKSYYLAPQADSEKTYVLLLRAMQRAHRVGIGRFVLRTKPHLVAIRPLDAILGLETLYFADEVRPAAPLAGGLDAVRVGARELDVAEQLIEALRTDWIPERYADEYRAELLRMISERTPAIQEEEDENLPRTSDVERLMEALKASVEAAKRSPTTSKSSPRRKTG
jgi:DNA end-binding protein Ku